LKGPTNSSEGQIHRTARLSVAIKVANPTS